MKNKPDSVSKIKEFFFGNLPLKIAALFSGFMLWLILSMVG